MFCTQISVALHLLAIAYAPDFGPPTIYSAGAGPMAKGDFNGDGRVDLVVSGDNALYVFLGRGDGTFQAAVASPARPNAYYNFVVADFNGDGRVDVAGIRYDSSAIQFGNGDGTFQAPVGQYSFGYRAAAGDVNGDGATDLVVAYAEAWPDDTGWSILGGVQVFLNRGDGTLDFDSDLDGIYYSVSSMELVDYDRDGDLDLVICDYKWDLILYDGFGNGAFGGLRALGGAEYEPEGVVIGDFNGDGALDLMLGPGYYQQFQPFLGRGNGAFDAGPTYQAGGNRNPAAADFNRDGKLDVICSDSWRPGGVLSVLLGDGGGGLAAPQSFQVGETTIDRRLIVADFNGDGYPDVAAAIGEKLCVVLNDRVWSAAPPLMPWVHIGDDSVVEGNSATRPTVFTVRLSSASSTTVTVDYTTENGSAAAGEDYLATAGRLTFAPGETSKTISVQVIGDRVQESNETFRVRLTAATGAVIMDGVGEGEIIDEEPSISINDVALREGGNRQTTPFTFTVTLSSVYDAPVTVSYRTANGSASAGSDYASKSGTLVFAPGEITKTIKIEVNGDNKREPNEVFYVDLFGASSNADIARSRGTGTILNDD